jgi:hypothetical protein
MSKIRIKDVATRVRHLTPFDAGNLKGNYAAVLSPISLMPRELQDGQRRRTETYMASGDRNAPLDAPRYYVTSYGELVAWVTMDGQTHYVDPIALDRTQAGHQSIVRAEWPIRFAADGPLFD